MHLAKEEENMALMDFHNYSIRKKISVGFGAMLVLALVAGAFSMLQMSRMNEANTEITGRRLGEIHFLNALQSGINATRRS